MGSEAEKIVIKAINLVRLRVLQENSLLKFLRQNHLKREQILRNDEILKIIFRRKQKNMFISFYMLNYHRSHRRL